MLIKATLLGVFAASTPLYLYHQNPTDQDPTPDEPTAVQASLVDAPNPAPDELALLRQRHSEELQRLEEAHAEELEQLRAEYADATANVKSLSGQLNECMDFLLAPRPRHNSCRPDRRPISKHYQWMRKNGHDAHADKALAVYVKSVGDKNRNLNSAAWSLMTNKDTAGQYDDLALGLANRMEQKGGLDHRQLDTVALAKFLNGHVDDAINFQKKAIKHGGNNDDYRRRLRTYEAAKKNSVVADKPCEAEVKVKPTKSKRRRVSDEE